MKKRNCRMTGEEKNVHERAVKLRKMTDEKLVEHIDHIREEAYNTGYSGFEEYNHIAKITINRERYRNAFTPLTTWEMAQAFNYCRDCLDIRGCRFRLLFCNDRRFCTSIRGEHCIDKEGC